MEMQTSMRFFYLFCLLCIFSFVQGCSNTKGDEPVVSTSCGSVVGKHTKVFDTEVASFLGIPYAEPPINQNRFRKPIPLQRWKGTLDATKKPPACMQYSTKNYSWIPKSSTPSEDCLYLNIWTPSKCCCSTSDKLPVLVWIYGGGFYAGSTDMGVYDGSTVAAYGKVVVVTINYRVGLFGFLKAGNEKAPGNMGLEDQSLALKWVKKNIEYFGGDSNSITLFGESAGAISVSLHMLSPASKNLFNRAILQSGTAMNPQLVDGDQIAYIKANAYAKEVGCIEGNSTIESDPDVIECLKAKDALELAKAQSKFSSNDLIDFLPTYGNEFVPVDPMKSISEGHIAPVDVLIGNTLDEANIFLNYIITPLFPLNSEPSLNLTMSKAIISALFQVVPTPPSTEIFQQYFQNLAEDDSAGIVEAISHAFGDYVFYCPVKFFAEKLPKAYMYWYTHKSMKNQRAEWVGTTHFDEVPFVFGVPIHDTSNYTPEDGKFSEDLIQMWTNFARTGYPLESEWPAFSSSQPNAFELNSRSRRVLPYPRTTACEYWRPYFNPK